LGVLSYKVTIKPYKAGGGQPFLTSRKNFGSNAWRAKTCIEESWWGPPPPKKKTKKKTVLVQSALFHVPITIYNSLLKNSAGELIEYDQLTKYVFVC
jgi:hypothetical protein